MAREHVLKVRLSKPEYERLAPCIPICVPRARQRPDLRSGPDPLA